MDKIDMYKDMLHNTMLYTKGYDFDSTKKMGGLYDLLEQLRPFINEIPNFGTIDEPIMTTTGMDKNMYKFRPDIDELVDMIKNGLDDNSFTDMLLAKCEQLRPHLKSEQDELKIELADLIMSNESAIKLSFVRDFNSKTASDIRELINKIKELQ